MVERHLPTLAPELRQRVAERAAELSLEASDVVTSGSRSWPRGPDWELMRVGTTLLAMQLLEYHARECQAVGAPIVADMQVGARQ